MNNQENETWPPPFKKPPIGINPTSTKSNRWYLLKSGLLLGVTLNALTVLMSAQFLTAPRGSKIKH